MFDRKVAVGAPRVMDLAEDKTHRSATLLFCFLTVTLIMSENVCKCLKYPACGHYNLIMSPPQGRKIIFDTLNFFKKIVILKHLRCQYSWMAQGVMASSCSHELLTLENPCHFIKNNQDLPSRLCANIRSTR